MPVRFWNWEQILRVVEKPSLAEAPSNLGSVPLYIFSPRLLEYLPKIKPSPRGELELQDAMHPLIAQNGKVHGLLLKDRIDLTLPEDLLRLNLHFLRREKTQARLPKNSKGMSTIFKDPVVVDPDVEIGNNCLIGPNVYLERGCSIGDEVRLMNSVVLRGVKVLPGTVIQDQVIW